MPGSASRFWCGSFLLNTVQNFREAFLSGSRKALGIAFLSESEAFSRPAPVSRVRSSIGGKGFVSSRTWLGGEIHSRVSGFQSRWSQLLCSKSNLETYARAFSQPTFCFSAVLSPAFSQYRYLASSTSYAGKRPSAGRQGKKPATGFKSNLRSSRKGIVPRKAKPFSGALSAIKHLQSDNVKGKSRSILGRRDSKKRVAPFTLMPGRSDRGPPQDNTRPNKEVRFKDPANADRLQRTRKRIRPCPRDITYKRGLESELTDTTHSSGQEATQGKAPSLNAKFRQIQPSKELLEYIEENLLGRRRLAEWRKGGYDPKRTAPLDDLPDSKKTKNPIQETVFKQKLTFVAAAKQSPSLPLLQFPEVAFAGRSNVGKSSLINALTRQWGVARTSPKPGLTQSINFFTLGSQLCLVDLPGYGFAYAKEGLKEGWEELVKEYVQTRVSLKRVCLLVDAKWGLKPRDQELLQLMESAHTRYQIVLTKTDLLPPLDLARRATQMLEMLQDHKYLIQPLELDSPYV